MWELSDIVECLPYTDRNMWETGRLQAYTVAKITTKNLKLTDMCQFPWEKKDKEKEEEPDHTISNNDIERLKELSKQFNDVQWQEIR